MDNETLHKIQQNLANSPVRGLYADEIVVAHTVKTGKDSKGKTTKEGHFHLVFIDMTTHRPVDKVIISPLTAKGLHNALGESIAKMDAEMKSKGKVKKAEKSERIQTDYIR